MAVQRFAGSLLLLLFTLQVAIAVPIRIQKRFADSEPKHLCEFAKESGSCDDLAPKWYYDVGFGQCQGFWYGGCEGNDNRFDSDQECQNVCVNPDGKSQVCQLPRVQGPCRGEIPAWFHNATSGQCEQFGYGGCHGNRNRFESRIACEAFCLN